MTKDEALRMAIEVFDMYGNKMNSAFADEAYQACKEALAETQEAVYTNGDRTMSMKDRNFTSEGNGYIQDNNFDFDAGLRIDGDFVNDELDQYAQMICNALNTTPPSREWQCLSYEEILRLEGLDCVDEEYIKRFARAIEAKLKEKNNG